MPLDAAVHLNRGNSHAGNSEQLKSEMACSASKRVFKLQIGILGASCALCRSAHAVSDEAQMRSNTLMV